MILKLHVGYEKWKYIDGIIDPEVEVVSEHILAGRLGLTVVRFEEMLNDPQYQKGFVQGFLDIIRETLAGKHNWLYSLGMIPPNDPEGLYPGQFDVHLWQPQPGSDDKPGIAPRFKGRDGQLMLAIRCARGSEKWNIFTNCETYLLNDEGRTLNRLI